jgi:hypothetical protein
MCSTHYSRFVRHGHTDQTRRRKVCVIDGCTEGVHAENLCQAHLYRLRKYGGPVGVQLEIPEGPVSLPLHDQTGAVVAHTTVDGIDSLWLNQWRWSLNPNGYAYRTESGRTFLLARLLMGVLDAGSMFQVDHINRNRLDNRRQNLRVVTAEINNANKGPVVSDVC